MLAAFLAGCEPHAHTVPAPRTRRHVGGPERLSGRLSDYWTRARLAAAAPFTDRPRRPQSPSGGVPGARVGALFFHDISGSHFCTASVVDSQHDDLLITAAHCVASGGTVRSDVVFVPAYREGAAPYGIWQVKQVVVDQRWIASADPDLDVAFIVLLPQNGKNITDVLGANAIMFNPGAENEVRVTGYPDTASAPITCVARTTALSATQLRFRCGGYATGTSGSPWLLRLNPATHTGTVIGVIGGYEEGGKTPDVSYSPYFGSDIAQLYATARVAG